MLTSVVKSFIKIVLFTAVISLGSLAHADRNIQSFREWKTSKISEAEVKIKIIKDKIGAGDPNYNWNPTDKMEAGVHSSLIVQLEKEELNLSNLKDLGISDYYVGYLLKQSSLDDAIHSVSGKLTAEDIAELMRAYAEQFSTPVKQQSKSASRLDFSQ
ncbi:MAG: hypothetical protein K0R29_2588 [Pseudobdellovibrio sp.]|nr:hypothetical protein [Pseudobdellovibrio sp.]